MSNVVLRRPEATAPAPRCKEPQRITTRRRGLPIDLSNTAMKRTGVTTTMAAAALVLAMMAASAAAQGTPLTCASKLVPCQQFLNSSKPPAACCGPLKDAVTNDLSCLCAIFRSPEILKAFNIDANQALNLPVHCGISNSSANLCNTAAGGSPSGSPVSPGSPPAAPGNSNDGAHGIGRVGFSGLAGLLLICWLMFIA